MKGRLVLGSMDFWSGRGIGPKFATGSTPNAGRDAAGAELYPSSPSASRRGSSCGLRTAEAGISCRRGEWFFR
ncbi:hypothetical protein LIER_26748 [Lithospermum erythrorhizon]|uniref:Uncharacterized protein n=1 Tax=Lithospermum erythrorhizon TaxID=34254 RepID=A0AAV3R9R1_LITER